MPAALVQVPIGTESDFSGVVDLIRWKAIYNKGVKGYAAMTPWCLSLIQSADSNFARTDRLIKTLIISIVSTGVLTTLVKYSSSLDTG